MSTHSFGHLISSLHMSHIVNIGGVIIRDILGVFQIIQCSHQWILHAISNIYLILKEVVKRKRGFGTKTKERGQKETSQRIQIM